MRGGPRPGAGRKPALFDEKRALALKSQGISMREIARRFDVSEYAIKWFFRKQKKNGTTTVST
jgi:transposase